MVRFSICTHVEQQGLRRFIVRAMAIPCDVDQRCAPEERAITCPSLEKAQAAGVRLAHELAQDVAARGNCVVDETPSTSPEPSAPARRRSSASKPETATEKD